MTTIDWADPRHPISSNFTVHEALWLPSARMYALPTDEEKANIVDLAVRMERVRELFGVPIHVHCWLRPRWYNSTIKGASPDSQHLHGKAVDFHVYGYEGATGCAKARSIILPHLEEFELRMEDKQGGWVHLDTKSVDGGGRRFFKP